MLKDSMKVLENMPDETPEDNLPVFLQYLIHDKRLFGEPNHENHDRLLRP